MHLNKSDIEKIKNLSAQFIAALVERSQNPSDYDTNIACLRKFGAVTVSFKKILEPYCERAEDYEVMNLAREAKELFLSDELNAACRREFAKEPRITNLGADMSQSSSFRGNTLFAKKDQCVFNITFSDGDVLKLHSLDNQKELAKGRRYFEEKMQELSVENRMRLSN